MRLCPHDVFSERSPDKFSLFHYGMYGNKMGWQVLWIRGYNNFYQGFDSYASCVYACMSRSMSSKRFTDMVLNTKDIGEAIWEYYFDVHSIMLDEGKCVVTDFLISGGGVAKPYYMKRNDPVKDIMLHPVFPLQQLVYQVDRRYQFDPWNQKVLSKMLENL